MKKILLLTNLLLLFLSQGILAQKISIDDDAYKEWRRVTDQNISDDGEWLTYSYAYADYMLSEKDIPCTYLYNTKTDKEICLKNVSNSNFFNNGKWLKYKVKDSTFLLCLKSGKKIYWDRNISFMERPNSNIITFSNTLPDKRLVILNVETGDSTLIDNIEGYTLFNNDKSIVYIKRKGKGRSLMIGDLGGKHKTIYSNENGLLGSFSLDRDGKRVTYTVASDSLQISNPNLLYCFSVKDGRSNLILDINEIQLPGSYRVAGRAYDIPENGKQIMLEVAPKIRQVPKEMRKPDKSFELELWTWDEAVSQRRQRRNANSNNSMSYPQFIYHIDTKRCVQLTSGSPESIIVPDCSEYGYIIATDTKPYNQSLDWLYDTYLDLYLVNADNGETKLLGKNFHDYPIWSPNGKYAIVYDAIEKAWYKLDPEVGKFENISKIIGYPFYDEGYDMPRSPDAYGIAGWINGGNGVVIYDRYDLWVFDLSGITKPYSLTKGYGRKNCISFRLLNANFDPNLDITKDLLLKSFNEKTKGKGVYSLTLRQGIKKLIDGDYIVNVKKISANGKTCIWTKENYHTFGDLWCSDVNFSNPVRITNANPQQEKYNWGSVRVVRWKNYEDKMNEGLLFLPGNYDSTKTYPMIVNFYETHSNDLHNYILPEHGSATINIVDYVSNGYIVFRPDVHFTVGEPGESSYNAVVSGTQEMIKRGIADKDRVGIQGHSWSGYQVAYLVTRTNIFKCANPEAGVVNMVSNYTALRETGAPRMFMYEVGQCRLGKTLWDDPQMYISNSPIFNANKIETPLLIFHCENDGAVSFTQGLDLFFAMRRLHKPAWLLNYKKEGHVLNGRAAQIDLEIRTKQFFGYYLKNEPMPRWMKEGIKIDERGIDQKYDYVRTP